jgi:hypothetical protein
MNTYQWLLILGFPSTLAAAMAAPELFTTDEMNQEATRSASTER